MEEKISIPPLETIMYTGISGERVEVEDNFIFFSRVNLMGVNGELTVVNESVARGVNRTIDLPVSWAVWQSAYMPDFGRVRKQRRP